MCPNTRPARPGAASATNGEARQPGQTAAPRDEVPHGWIMSRIRRMTLEEKVGQLFITYAYGSTAGSGPSTALYPYGHGLSY